jgi:Purple acid Phosphatase, N-terminal domain
MGNNRPRIGLFLYSLFAVVLIVVVAVLGYYTYLDSQISVRDLTITNVTDTAFTITWVSDDAYVSKVYFQESGKSWPMIFAQSGKEVAYDDRDVELNADAEYVQVEGGIKERFTHHITIRNLAPEKEYSFRIGGRINGKEPEVNKASTKPIAEDINTPDPGYGKIENAEKNDTILSFTYGTADSGIYSTYLSSQGTYSIDTSLFIAKDFDPRDLRMQIIGDESKREVNFSKKTYKPLETVILKDTDQPHRI